MVCEVAAAVVVGAELFEELQAVNPVATNARPAHANTVCRKRPPVVGARLVELFALSVNAPPLSVFAEGSS